MNPLLYAFFVNFAHVVVVLAMIAVVVGVVFFAVRLFGGFNSGPAFLGPCLGTFLVILVIAGFITLMQYKTNQLPQKTTKPVILEKQ